MNTKTTRNRWTNKEINILKEVLKFTNGNQKKAATILSDQLDRSMISIQVKLCGLAKQHPSLRKANIKRRLLKTTATTPTTQVKKVKSVEIKGNQLIISF